MRSRLTGIVTIALTLALLGARPAVAQEPALHSIELGVYAGYWNFDSIFRYEDDAVLGLRGGAALFEWLVLEVELDQITTWNRRDEDWTRAVSFAMHGRLDLLRRPRLTAGAIIGVAFMALDNDGADDFITEGLDMGPTVQLHLGERVDLRGDFILRYQSVKRSVINGNGGNPSAVEYVWSSGLRLGVGVAF